MADINTVISGIVEVQNKIISQITYQNAQHEEINNEFDDLSTDMANYIAEDIPDKYYNKNEIERNYYNRTQIDNKMSNFEVPGDLNKIESITVNGQVVEPDADKNVNIETSTINSLLFKIPFLEPSYTAHFKIEFSNDESFSNIGKSLDTSHLNTWDFDGDYVKNVKLFNGQVLESMSIYGIQYIFSDEQLILNIDSSYNNYPFFRFHWIISTDSEVMNGRWGFGKISATHQIFDGSAGSGDSLYITDKPYIALKSELQGSKQQSTYITSTSIVVSPTSPIYIYKTNIRSAKTFSFTWPDSTNVFIIELWLNITAVSSITLSGVTWIEEPDFTKTGSYCIEIRKYPSDFKNGITLANIRYVI